MDVDDLVIFHTLVASGARPDTAAVRERDVSNLDAYRILIERADGLHALADRAASPSVAAGLRAAAEVERSLASAVFQATYGDASPESCDGS